MPKYVIERELPGLGKSTPAEVKKIAQDSCNVLRTMSPDIQWVHSYFTDDKMYCIYNSPNEEMIREHAKKGRFPANVISKVAVIADPVSAE